MNLASGATGSRPLSRDDQLVLGHAIRKSVYRFHEIAEGFGRHHTLITSTICALEWLEQRASTQSSWGEELRRDRGRASTLFADAEEWAVPFLPLSFTPRTRAP